MSPSAALGAAGTGPDADASRAVAPNGVLMPTGEGSLNSRKRGHPAMGSKGSMRDAMAHLLQSTYTVKPHPPNLQVAPRVLQPLMLLPRQHLSLSCIDAVGSSSDLGHSRLFEAQIRMFDLESRLGSVLDLLVARHEPRGTVYALERQKGGLYAMCKLGAWVDLDELARSATAVAEEHLRSVAKRERREDAPDAFTTPQLHSEQKRKRAVIEEFRSLVKKRARAASTTTTTTVMTTTTTTLMTTTTASTTPPPPLKEPAGQDNTAEPEGSAASQAQSPQVKLEESFVAEAKAKENAMPPAESFPDSHPDSDKENIPQLTAGDVFEKIRSHYFDVLYKSMGSLAYFAKGQLSRARSMFHLDLDSNLNMSDLIDFLKGLILTTVQIDTKYRNTVPDLVSKMTGSLDSSDEGGRKKKRKSKKMKIGKDAIYPTEDDIIRKWWAACKSQLMEDSEADISSSQIKSHISVLRTRETQLQMILIMEILALEPLRGSVDQGECGLPGDTDAPDVAGATSQPPKKRNKHNLPLLLDVHADRLTIWQSTASDEQILLEDSQSARVATDGTQGKKASSEPLKDFCIDVIVPFFSARLPELCDSINRKLGGPAIIAPPTQSKAAKQPHAKEKKPGHVARRSTPSSSASSSLNPRRTLQRALSTDQQSRRSVSRGPSSAIALLRSATPSLISNINRDGADIKSSFAGKKRVSLSGDEPNNHHNRHPPPSLSRSKSLSSLRDAKTSKDAELQAELKEAISAIRKPNRDVVGKARIEADERRSSSLTLKKSRKSAVASKASNIQVKATPVNNRFKDAMAPKASTQPSQDRASLDAGLECVPPSSIGPVERTIRPGAFNSIGETPRKHDDNDDDDDGVVGDTPIRQPSFLRPGYTAANDDMAPMESPRRAAPSHAVVPGSAVKSSMRGAWDTNASGRAAEGSTVGATPVKRPTQRLIFGERSASQSSDRGAEKSMDLYDRLGWNNDFDDLA